jgi:hypothetical protein
MRGAKHSLLRFKQGCIFAALCLMSVAPVHAHLAQSVGTAQTVIITPLSLVKVSDLDFGQVFRKSTAGTVTISPAEIRSQTGGLLFGTAPISAASFAGLGRRNQFVDISLSASSIFVTGPGTRMRVRNFVIGSTPTATLSTVPLRFRITSTNGAFLFPLGATLDVGANQVPGVYTGSYRITVQYQ